MLHSIRLWPTVATVGASLRLRGTAALRGFALCILGCLAVTANAAPLNLVQDPAGAGLYTALVNDSFTATGVANADEFTFEGEVGDNVNARIEATVGNSQPRVRILNTTGTVLASINGGSDGVGLLTGYVITTPGTYRVQVYTDTAASAYAMRVDLTRGANLEDEPNDTVPTANVLKPEMGSGSFNFAVAGLLHGTDTAGDTFALGLAPAGVTLNATVQLPSSTLTAADVSTRIYERRTSDRSLDFTNSTYATIPHNAAIDAIETSSTFTMEAWLYIRAYPQGYFCIFDQYRATGDTGWAFAIQNGGGLFFWNNGTQRTSGIMPTLNAWNHVAVTYDHAGNAVRFYLNGVQSGANQTSAGALLNTDVDPAYLGLSPSGGDEYSNGQMAEFRLWNRALSAAEILANYNNSNLNPSTANLVGLWRFDEGSGLTANDLTANANHISLGGGDASRAPAWGPGVYRLADTVAGTSINRTYTTSNDVWLQLSASANRGLSARYYLTGTQTDTQNLNVVATSLPSQGGITTAYTQSLNVTFDDELNPDAANNAANYTLVGAGPDATFGTSDDFNYTFVNPNYANGTTLTLDLANGPLQLGAHRFTIGVGMRDRAGNPLSSTFTREFTSQRLNDYQVENQSNATFATATNLTPMTVDGTGYIARARGNVSIASDQDYYSFTANAGDRVLFNSENPDHIAGTGQLFYVFAPNQSTQLAGFGTYDGTGQGQFVASATGTYYVRVQQYYGYYGEYRFSVSVFPGSQTLEAEGNDSAGAASDLAWTQVGATRNASGAGTLQYGDPSDWYSLSYLDVGTQISVNATKPPSSTITWIVDILKDSTSVISAPAGSPSLAYTVPAAAAGNYYVRFRPSTGGGLNGYYRFDLSVTDTSTPTITASTLPAEGASPGNFFGNFTLSFSENLAPATVNASGTYELRNAGADNTFGTGDDQLYTVVPFSTYASGLSASYRLSNGPLQPGLYRFTASTALTDTYGNAMAAPFVRNFSIVGNPDFQLESRSNDTFATAMPITSTSDGSMTIFRGRGHTDQGGDQDYYSFTANAGDRVLIVTENPDHQAGTGQLFYIFAPNQSTQMAGFGTYDGTGQSQFVAPSTGTYFVRVQQYYDYRGEYRFAVMVQPNPLIAFENEANDSAGAATGLTWTEAAGSRTSALAAVVAYGDPSDWYALGFLDVGTQITVNATKPASSGLTWVLDVIQGASTVVATSANNASSITFTVPATKADSYYVRLRPLAGGYLLYQYSLTFTLADLSAPTIASDTLPAQGTTSTTFFGDFSVSFSEVLRASTVNDLSNFDLRAAGTDGLFDTADDQIYTLALTATYTGALNATFRVTDGPVQPGNYRFQAKTGLLDTYGNALAAVYTRLFTVGNVPNYQIESRSNDTLATATSLAPLGETGVFGGSWSDGVNYATGGNSPMGIGSADFDGDGKLDLVVANYDGGNVSFFRGNGDGTFITPATLYAAPNNPFKVAVGDLNGDGRPDFAVGRYGSTAVRVFINNGSGGFATGVDYTTAQGSAWLAFRDLNGDGSLDIVTSNYNASSFSILYNNGNGTFAATINQAVTGNPYSIATGDLNGDGRIDLAIGTWTDRAVKIFYRQANGSYAAGDVFTWGAADGISSVAIGDVNDDGRLDVLAVSQSGAEVRRWHQQANGTLVAATPLNHGGNVNNYSVMVQDYNGDGRNDVIVGRNDYVSLFENRGNSTFGLPNYNFVGNSREARQVVVADFNGDGRPDIATTAQQGHAIRIFLGRGTQTLAADGDGFIGRGRGQIAISSDVDYYSFSAKAGDRIIVGLENPDHAAGTGQNIYLLRPEGTAIDNVATYYGTGQIQAIAPVTGIYGIRVQQYYGYYGEYRFAVAVLPGTMGLESEGNDSAGPANPVAWTSGTGVQTAQMAGVTYWSDPGDWFTLGALAEGAQITVSATKPPSSDLTWLLDILNSSSQVVASGVAGATPISYTIPTGNSGTYYARIRTAGTGSLMSQYLLSLSVADTQAPVIVANSLPAAGSTVTAMTDRATLTFSEDMMASTVNDLANYDLRAAGPDNTFDTIDDVIIPLTSDTTYTTGLSFTVRTASNSPLAVGNYRFRALASLQDRYSNALQLHTRFFNIVDLPGYAFETEPNNTLATATALTFGNSQPDLYEAGGRGFMIDNNDVDFWSFNLQVGDKVIIQGETPGNPSNSALNYYVYNPAGGVVLNQIAENNGIYQLPTFTATQAGLHKLRVTIYYGYNSEYRFRIYIIRGGMQAEVEPNNTIATASPLVLTMEGNNARGSLAGTARLAGDLDYVNLGTLSAGTTVFLSTRQPASSTFVPVVSLYNAAGSLIPEAGGGRPGDPVSQVSITTNGVYYALVRTSGQTTGVNSSYILDVLVVPTAGISFPNLQATSLTPPPATGLKSGDNTTISFRVDNLGNLATAAVTWVDRVVLSSDPIYGNADDMELGVFSHSGPLAANSFYTVSGQSVRIPDGISGSYYVIVRTDHTNTVSEFVLEGDNETVTDTPINITLADYPDLVVENLAVSDSDGSGNRTATWTLANRGTGTAGAGFSERIAARNIGTGNTILNTLVPVASAIAPNGTLARQATITTTSAGNYLVEVTADAQLQRYEYNAQGNANAEANNVATANFSITQLYTIAVSADPVGAGSVTGGGTFVEGSNRTVTATAVAPYLFVGWFEGQFLRSVNASYTSPLLSDRTLVARFAPPSYNIGTQVAPAGTGTVSGGGVATLGNTVTLTASALPGYRFDHWSEGATNLGTTSPLTFSAAANRTITANFAEANPTHAVTTATNPASIATVTGAGTYNNGQTATITAPTPVSAGETEYVFERFLLNGTQVSTSPTITKTFTTQDSATFNYVAQYKSQGLKPLVAQVAANLGAKAGITANYQITIKFDRAMNQAVRPLVELISANSTSIPAVPPLGAWTLADTYVVPAIAFTAANGGDYTVRVSLAQDTQGRVMNPANVFNFTVDVTAPELPTLVAGAVTATSATVNWTAYAAPADLASFRLFRSTANFTTTDGLSPVGSLAAGLRSYGFAGLDLDTDYYVAVVPVDNVGNALTTVTPLKIRVASTIPPAVAFNVAALSTNSARISWTFDPATQIGFQGFKVYRASAAFTSIAGLTPIATLAADVRSYDDLNLDRAQTHHYAVVGYNRLGESLTAVVSKPWTDPLSGTLAADFTASDPVLIITQPITITNGATFTVPPGTVVAFGPGASLTVQSGRLVANGTLFAPIVFTSLADVENNGPTRGTWNGITLSDATRTSVLNHTWIKYGRGLTITAGTHNVDTLGSVWNDVAGLRLTNAVTLSTQSAYLANNVVGATIANTATLSLAGSILKNNTVNASATGTGTLDASGAWWGTADSAAIAASVSGAVTTSSPMASEPILTRGLRSADGATTTGSANLPMQLASLNAVGYRVSEDSSFAGVLFVDVPRNPLSSDLFNTAPWPVTVSLSAGGGTKTLYAQFRSLTGTISPTVTFTTNYVTSGPVITAFSLTEGLTINRPLNVTAATTSALPIAKVEFFVDDVSVTSVTTNALSTRWDVRNLSPGVHRVRLVATDSAGNTASRSLNITINPQPPAKPVITAPVTGFQTTVAQVNVSGTAEALGTVRILRNGTVVATVTANDAGQFTAPNVALVEGSNELVASGYDAFGSTSSASVYVNSDTGAPLPVTLLPIVYNPNEGLFVDWDLPTGGEVPVLYRVFWHTAPFTSVAQATGQSDMLLTSYTVLKTVPDGLRYFAVVGYDEAGNASPLSNLQSYTLDLTPPAFTVAYSQTMPIGPGTLGITVTASEALTTAPTLLMRPEGGGLLAVTLTPAGGNVYTASFPVTTLSARSGTTGVGITGTDLAGNTFTGAPTGPALVFDLTKPTGIINTSRTSPIQTSTDVTMSVSLVLSEPVKVGTQPTLSFSPPLGSQVPVTLTGSGVNWNGQLTVTSAMDNGNGTFLLSATDAVNNVGTVITVGEKLELYNTATPAPAAVPSNFTVAPQKGGYIRLTWNAADKAHSYRIYREAGASAAVPTTLVASDVTALTIDDLPPADGPYRYVVTSYRLGAESSNSGVRATTSDRTPPPAPTATTATLGVTGININWTPASELPAKWVVYRNGTAIRTISDPSATFIVDSPPRGVMNYRVAASDTLGNEALGPTATIELLVGAVANLRATVDAEIGTELTWTSTDATGVGYNIYRNGTKQNSAPVTLLKYTDTLPAAGQPVQYAVKAVNALAQESAARVVLVQPVTTVVRLNPATDTDLPSVARYFDTYSIAITGGANASAPIAFADGDIVRAVTGETPGHAVFPLPASVAANETKTATVVIAAPNIVGVVQGVAITLATDPGADGSVVAYRIVQDFASATASGLMISISSAEPPLAGGLTDFSVQVYNRGSASADLVLSRGGNTQPGDLEMLITNAAGVLVSTTPIQAAVPGVLINAAGDAFLRLAPGASVTIPVDELLVPEALGVQTVTFRARFKAIYNDLGTPLQRKAGPLEGSMSSSLRVTPYYATSSTAQPNFSDNQPVVISGFAINRETGLPMANVPVRIGILVRGAVLYFNVMTDANGAYSYSYTPSLGLSGELVIWAVHPDVVDQLNQTRVKFYRIFTKPGRIEAVMTKNDHLDFDIQLLNTSDISLSDPQMTFRAYRVEGGNEVPVPGLTASLRQTIPTTLGAKSEPRVYLRLTADLSVPDDALFEFSFTTAQGASTKMPGTISFRPALPILTVTSPTTGYAEAGLSRGQLKSVDVTVANRGLRALEAARIVPPANVPWMQINLAPNPDGTIPLGDIPVGGTRTFSVVFAPPDETAVGFYSDFLLIKGDNSTGDYRLNLFSTVTSEEKGSVQFAVTNTFSNPVPNTSIWMRNVTLGIEVGPFLTDVNGQVIVPNLMEGDWQWKTNAAGHGATQGVVTVIPDQTVGVETEITIQMVTVKFSVVPVPFTDYYEIKIEQTFQTRTPIPNLIMSPPHQSLSVEAGFTGTLLYTLRNEGLRSIFDVVVDGGDLPTMRATPLISFIPEIKAQETIQVPVYFEYFGPAEVDDSSANSNVAAQLRAAPSSARASAAAASAASFGAGATAKLGLGDLPDIYDCYKNMKYGTITLRAVGGIESVSGKPYTVGVNATIDVDEILALVCDGDCPERWTGGGVVGGLLNKACSKLVGKIVEQVGKKTKVIDIVCKASNIIKAIACAAAYLPTGTVSGGPSGGGPGGGGGYIYGGGYGGGWSITGAGCFVAGTEVTLADGTTLPIEQVKQGMSLLASSGGADKVAQLMFLSSDHVREVTYRSREDANAPTQTLRLTHDHRVWVDGKGWEFASQLRAGDWLHGADGKLHEVISNDRLEGRHDVYGLHMGSDNVIYAGGVLTEDQCFQATPNFSVSPQIGGAR